jgi:hypothetical protein
MEYLQQELEGAENVELNANKVQVVEVLSVACDGEEETTEFTSLVVQLRGLLGCGRK